MGLEMFVKVTAEKPSSPVDFKGSSARAEAGRLRSPLLGFGQEE
jgi:hypothetical protein